MIIDSAFVPFSLALAVLAALLVVELLGLLLGWSLIAEAEADLDLEVSSDAFDIDPELGELDAQIETAVEAAADLGAGPATALEMTEAQKAPFILRLAAFCLVFGGAGLALQTAASALMGAPLSALLAVALVAPLGWFGAGVFSRLLTTLVPQTETTATRVQFMGGLRGVVTQGTARRGSPAEVRLRDRHGNMHYLRCEPLRAEDVIPMGAEVLTVRRRVPPEARLRGDGADDWALSIVPLTD